jgi:anti-sigma factor RsiW
MSSCLEIQPHLSEYLDGDLSHALRSDVERHLGRCLTCSRELKEMRAIVEKARGLPREIRPRSDLWPAIEARLSGTRPFRSTSTPTADRGRAWWLQLAAACLLVLAVPLSIWWFGWPAAGPEPAPLADATADPATMVLRAELARAEDGVMLTRTDLLTAVERHRGVLEDETLQALEEDMRLLDRAIGEIRVALERHPHDRRLHLLLAARYQQERKLLQKVSRA